MKFLCGVVTPWVFPTTVMAVDACDDSPSFLLPMTMTLEFCVVSARVLVLGATFCGSLLGVSGMLLLPDLVLAGLAEEEDAWLLASCLSVKEFFWLALLWALSPVLGLESI